MLKNYKQQRFTVFTMESSDMYSDTEFDIDRIENSPSSNSNYSSNSEVNHQRKKRKMEQQVDKAELEFLVAMKERLKTTKVKTQSRHFTDGLCVLLEMIPLQQRILFQAKILQLVAAELKDIESVDKTVTPNVGNTSA